MPAFHQTETVVHTLMRRAHRFARFSGLCTFGLLSVSALAAATVASFPPGTLLENVAVASSGNLFVTAIDSGTVFNVSPSGSSNLFGQVSGPLLGVAFNADGTLFAAGRSSLYRFAANGMASLAANIAGAADLNGVALLMPGVFLVADDVASTIWKVDVNTGSSSAWLSGGLLVPSPGGLPIGPNGIKLYGGAVYVSNTGAGTILRVPVLTDGSAGTPEVYASSLSADDFAFASDGSLFAATELGQIVHLRPNGDRTTISTGTLGDAAVGFGRTPADSQSIYVVNNGGAYLDLPGGPEQASVVRLDVGATGVVPELQAVPEPSSFRLLVIAGIIVVLCSGYKIHSKFKATPPQTPLTDSE